MTNQYLSDALDMARTRLAFFVAVSAFTVCISLVNAADNLAINVRRGVA